MPFINPLDHEPLELVPGVRARTPFGQNIMMSYLELDAGSVVPLHQHPHEQAGMVIEGRMELTIGDETRICETHSMFIIPPNTAHAARPVDGPALIIDIFSPVREDYAEHFNKWLKPI